ncbi:MAG: WYL domain-containing protein [Sulfurimonas sp.]|nr:WYL domain-containing protein [Sulfurimonas sp.]
MGYKHDYDKTLYRLTVILQKLYEGESLSITQLADEFGTSTRTVQRDFNEKLTQFPIIKDGKKWKMRDGFHIEKLKSVEDQLVLDMLEKVSENLGTNFSQKAKLILSKIKNPDLSPIYTNLNIEDIGSSMKNINLIEQAILQKSILTCNYLIGTKSHNIGVKPLKIANFEGFWYLVAMDSRNDVLKKYHIKSISNIKILDKTFTRSKDLDESLKNAINIWFNIENTPFEVILHVNGTIAKYFQRKPISKSQVISSINSDDGSLELSLKITHVMEIIPTILHWLPHIKVIEPEFLKEEIIQSVEEYLKDITNQT